MLDCVRFLLMVAACLLVFSAGQRPFIVNVTQKIYQVEEQKNVTMTWLYLVDPDGPPPSLHIDLRRSSLPQSIYQYNSRSKAKPYVHHNYSGRLQCSHSASSGQVEFSIAHLKPSDSDKYVCIIVAGKKSSSCRVEVMVTAVQGQPEHEEPEPASRGRIGSFVSLGLLTVVVVALVIRYLAFNASH